jgi:hypothetical protein
MVNCGSSSLKFDVMVVDATIVDGMGWAGVVVDRDRNDATRRRAVARDEWMPGTPPLRCGWSTSTRPASRHATRSACSTGPTG